MMTPENARKRMIQHLLNNDADSDEESKNGGGKKSGHGNTRIPYGLCVRFNISLPDGATPKDAWDALAKKGVNQKDVYKQLKESGTVKGYRPKKGKKHGIKYRNYSRCKTVGSAQEFLEKNLPLTFVKYDNLEGITPKAANSINNAILSIYHEIGLKPSMIWVDNNGPNSYGNCAYVRKGDTTLNLCPEFVKTEDTGLTPEDWKRQCQNQRESSKRTLKREKGNPTWRSDYAKEVLEYSRNGIKYNRAFVKIPGKEYESIVTHEMGHILEHKLFDKTLPEEGSIFGNYYGAKKSGEINDISMYAESNPHEYFAECFTLYMMGEDMPEKARKMIETDIDILKKGFEDGSISKL